MTNHLNELRKIAGFYHSLADDLSAAIQERGSGNDLPVEDRILQNRSRMSQIERMNAHMTRLFEDLRTSRVRSDPEMRAEADRLTAEVKSHAGRIREICSMAARTIENNRNTIRRKLDEIGKGHRYLKSVYPVKNNFPKFIDSTG